jgi:hypothetical protein
VPEVIINVEAGHAGGVDVTVTHGEPTGVSYHFEGINDLLAAAFEAGLAAFEEAVS